MKIIISLIPVLLLTYYIYKKDKHKESLYMIVFLILGGIFSAIFSYALSEFTKSIVVDNLVFKNIVFIGFKEEFINFIVLILICFNALEFDEIYDSIVYSTFLSLGFIFIENIIYINSLNINLIDIILRSIMSCGVHFALGVTMGYFIGYAKDSQIKGKYLTSVTNIFLAFLLPSILHGIYDLLISLSIKNLNISFFVPFYVMILFIIAYFMFNKYLSLRNNSFVSFIN